MSIYFTWKTQIHSPKNKQQMLDTDISVYKYEDKCRVCFSNTKQKYYFEAEWIEGINEECLKSVIIEHFNKHRHEFEVARCIRCGKWNVIDGQFCERCNKAMIDIPNGSVEFDMEV